MIFTPLRVETHHGYATIFDAHGGWIATVKADHAQTVKTAIEADAAQYATNANGTVISTQDNSGEPDGSQLQQ